MTYANASKKHSKALSTKATQNRLYKNFCNKACLLLCNSELVCYLIEHFVNSPDATLGFICIYLENVVTGLPGSVSLLGLFVNYCNTIGTTEFSASLFFH
jgi:hypothetical protein